MDKLHTCCFIGHGYDNLSLSGLTENDIYLKIQKHVKNAVNDGYLNFICGAELGADLLFCEAIINEKKQHNISLICVLSSSQQSASWHHEAREQFANILDAANSVICLNEKNIKGCTAKRNQHIIDLSSYLITAYNGSKGQTDLAIKYAKKSGLKFNNILDIIKDDDSGQISF